MAKVKSIVDADQIRLYGTLDSNLNGTYFNNTASQTIFSFGSFVVTSNFEGRTPVDYSNTLSSFVRPVTLETMGLTDVQSSIVLKTTTEAVLNLDKSDLNTFVRFGSAYEFLRTTIQEIILLYPASIFAYSRTIAGGNITFSGFSYNSATNISEFNVPTASTVNNFGIICNFGNVSVPDNNELKNLNLSYDKYIIWSAQNPTGNSYSVIGFTGYSSGAKYLRFRVSGNPFPNIGVGTTGNIDFHIKPNSHIFEEFRALLSDYEKYILSERDGTNGFKFMMKDPTLLDNGNIVYSDSNILWSTTDGYNLDISGTKYRTLLETLLTIGSKYDTIKTDLIARFLTPLSIKTYDLTEEGKMTKLLRLYGREFDELRQFIDSLVNINRVTYDKLNNIPDQLVRNLARVFGWNYFSLVNENELVKSFLTISSEERNLNTDLMPAEIDIELWRRILINTSYFWKSKGTREAIKSMFLLIGIPEPFINITEYVYTVDGKINPNTVGLTLIDFPSTSLPYDDKEYTSDGKLNPNYGYPVAPIESNSFYFQISGDTDNGQAYMNNFRMAGFNLTPVVDNKKSWIQTGATMRIDDTTPQYYQGDSKLVLNTKEVDVALDTSRGIEYDVWDYIQTDFAANSSGFTMPYSFVNVSLDYTGTQSSFTLPFDANKVQGYLEVRYNGILLTANKFYDGSGILDMPPSPYNNEFDYIYNPLTNTIYLGNLSETFYAINSGNRRDVIQATFIYSGGTSPLSGITVQYVVARVSPIMLPEVGLGVKVPLPSYPRGDVQLTINGIALTKGTSQFTADYVLDPSNSTGGTNNIIITNLEIISYMAVHRNVMIAYVEVNGSNDINLRSEILRVDSFNSSKLYYNISAGKYVYKLNYKVIKASDIKILIDGIALEPPDKNGNGGDYSVNVMNQYEIFLPSGIKYGTVISVYYLVGGNSIFFPIVANNFGVGDISELSFLEFIELIQRRLINARNRKTITDFKGGWYPSLLRVYTEYLKRAGLDLENPLLSNGYTFNNLYSFLSKYNSFFQMFVDQLLSATIILKKSGLLIRNTVFTKQKFAYKRGVNLFASGSTVFDKRILYGTHNTMLPYFGDDGSTFLIAQGSPLPSAQLPTVITLPISTFAQTTATGGGNVTSDGGAAVTYRGVVWNTIGNPTTAGPHTADGGGLGTFASYMTNLSPNTLYYVRAYAINSVGVNYGDEITFTTAEVVVVPSIQTLSAIGITTNQFITGGYDIVGWDSPVEYYGMRYKKSIDSTWLYFPAVPVAGPLTANYTPLITIIGLDPDTNYNYYAYMIVGGNTYTGITRTAHTTALALAAPTVTTGTAGDITTTTMRVVDNTVDTKGIPATIAEYGVLYTQNSYWAAPERFKFENTPTNVSKTSITGDIAIGTPYFTGGGNTIINLAENTTTFYRAFARNGIGESAVGYGDIMTVQTLPVPPPTITQTYNQGTPGALRFQYFEVGGTILAGDIFTLTVYSHTVSVTAVFGDSPLSIVNKLIVAINATTAVQWNDHSSAPPAGTVGFKPTANLAILGAIIVLALNYQNQFGASAYRP